MPTFAPVTPQAWQRWRWVSWPFAAVALGWAVVAMTAVQVRGDAIVIVVAGALITLVRSLLGDDVRPAGVASLMVWAYVGVGIFLWDPPPALFLAVAVLASTPPARRLLPERPAFPRDPAALRALSDRALMSQWVASGRALRLSVARPGHALRIVTSRADLLEELRRRGLPGPWD